MDLFKYFLVLIVFSSCQLTDLSQNKSFTHNNVCYEIHSQTNQFLEISLCSNKISNVTDNQFKDAAREYLKNESCSVMNYIENSTVNTNKILMIRCN